MWLFVNENTSGSCVTGQHYFQMATGLQVSLSNLDLNLCECGRLKSLVYPVFFSDLGVTEQLAESACQEFRVKQQIFERVRTAVKRKP
jgi:hypothetical protein